MTDTKKIENPSTNIFVLVAKRTLVNINQIANIVIDTIIDDKQYIEKKCVHIYFGISSQPGQTYCISDPILQIDFVNAVNNDIVHKLYQTCLEESCKYNHEELTEHPYYQQKKNNNR